MIKVLVIEDETQIREEVMDWLSFEGYEVYGEANGRLGLATIQHNIPDLVLCDIAMPEMDGYEVLIEVRSDRNLGYIPFIFLTAAADRASVRRGMDMGADDYLTKPFTHAEVMNTVRSRLAKKEAQDKQLASQINSLDNAFNEERAKHLLKSRLVAMFSHDLRNPLATISTSSGVLRSYSDHLAPERRERLFDFIDGSVRHVLQMLDDMLITAEMESGHLVFAPQVVELPGFLQAIVDEFQLIDQGAHKLIFLATYQGQVMADPKLLRHILANLLSNAMKYSRSGTEITTTLDEADGELCLQIQDHGIGIPPESLPTLFQPFQRASNAKNIKGTGLGLTVVKECVDMHGGNIQVSSEIGQGTRFMVMLPCQPDGQNSARQ